MFPKSLVGKKRYQKVFRHFSTACDLFCVTRVALPQDGMLRNDRVPPLVRAQKE